MGAVDVGVGHDDDPLVAQAVDVEARTGAAAQGLDQVGQLLVRLHLVGGRAGDVEDLAAQRQHRLGVPVARLLGRAAGGIALDQEDLGAFGAVARAVCQLARQPQLAGRRLAVQLPLLALAQAVLGAGDDPLQQGAGALGMARQPVVEVVLDHRLDQARGLRRGQALLGLALELRVLDEDRQQGRGAAEDVLGGDLAGLAVAGQLAVGLEAAQHAAAQAGLVGAALGGRHGVAVGVDEALFARRPGDRPFDPAGLVRQLGLADEGVRRQGLAVLQRSIEKVPQAVGEVQILAFGDPVLVAQQGRIAAPADLHALVEIGLGARHAEKRRRVQVGALAEDLGVRPEGHAGAAAVRRLADGLQLGLGLAALILLTPELAVAGDFDHQPLGQRVDHRDADAVQAARGLIGLLRELGPGVQGGEDDL